MKVLRSPLGQERSESHVNRQRLVVLDRDRNRVFADNACDLRSRRKSTRVVLTEWTFFRLPRFASYF